MTRQDLYRAIRTFTFQLQCEEFAMDKPRRPARQFGAGMGARPRHVRVVFDAMQPLLASLLAATPTPEEKE